LEYLSSPWILLSKCHVFHGFHSLRRASAETSSPQPTIEDVSKRDLQLWKLILIYSEDMYSVLNCFNVAKHAEFYPGVTSNGNAGRFKKERYNGIPEFIVWQVLRKRLHLRTYKLSIVQHHLILTR
jgi:hypothetical protein